MYWILKGNEKEEANFSGMNNKVFKCDKKRKHGLHSIVLLDIGVLMVKSNMRYLILGVLNAIAIMTF